MSPEENKALVRRFYEEIDKGNLEAMDGVRGAPGRSPYEIRRVPGTPHEQEIDPLH